MNKILVRIIIIIIIAGIIILIVFKVREPFGKSNSSFASEPKDEITRIEFSQNGKKLTLEKKGDTWQINGKTEARKSGVTFILRILKEIKIKSPVSAELFKNEITEKNLIPVKVKVYEKSRFLKSFLVYKTNSNIYGNMMKVKENSKPFIVCVPGYEGDIGSGFNLNELFWQSYTVFNLLPSEIASVQFDNLADTSASFSIINRSHHYFLSNDRADITGWDSSLVVRYISYFAWIPFESWAFGMDDKDIKTIENQLPLYRISVLTTGGKKTVLTLWGLPGKKGTDEIDSDRLLGKTDARDEAFIMRYFDIDPLIKKRSYFFKQ